MSEVDLLAGTRRWCSGNDGSAESVVEVRGFVSPSEGGERRHGGDGLHAIRVCHVPLVAVSQEMHGIDGVEVRAEDVGEPAGAGGGGCV